jgi:hypothetical protein
MNWPSQNDAQFGSLVKPGKLNPGGLSSRIPHWIYPLGFLMSLSFGSQFSRRLDRSLAQRGVVERPSLND